jgi:hypothetical protein
VSGTLTYCSLDLLGGKSHVSDRGSEEEVHNIVTVIRDCNVGTIVLVIGDAAHAEYSLAACRKGDGRGEREIG